MKIQRSYFVLFTLFFCSSVSYAQQQQMQNVKISFRAVVGDKQFDCRETYEGIGTTGSTMSVSDFRFYVQDVWLIDKKGREVKLKFTSDGAFQNADVALLDFENGAGTCTSGTPLLHTSIVGEIPKRKFVGLKFRIGVPESLNHKDPNTLPAPLNISRMAWSWQMGYKFARIDTKTTGMPNGYVLHLGSTECKTDPQTNETKCGRENRPVFSFAKFDANKDTVAIDLKELFGSSNVDVNQPKTALGCMSFEGDSDCSAIFKTLGLMFAGEQPGTQTFIRLERYKASSRSSE